MGQDGMVGRDRMGRWAAGRVRFGWGGSGTRRERRGGTRRAEDDGADETGTDWMKGKGMDGKGLEWGME